MVAHATMLKSLASNRGNPVAEPQDRVDGQTHPGSTRDRRRRYVSERGPFEIRANPEITTPSSRGTPDKARTLQIFEHSDLAEKYGEGPVQEKILEMAEALSGGITSTRLFGQDESPNGMRLSHVWFGANFPLFRHSHPGSGDCLYYVIAGEIVMGRRKLRAGSVMFLPNGMPYKFKAGPAGAEVLEFHADRRDPERPGPEARGALPGVDPATHRWRQGTPARVGSAGADRRYGLAPGGG